MPHDLLHANELTCTLDHTLHASHTYIRLEGQKCHEARCEKPIYKDEQKLRVDKENQCM